MAAEKIDASVPKLCFPLDWPLAVKRVLRQVEPDIFVLVETDIWPNFMAALHNYGCPAVLVNARVSPRSLSGYRLLKPLWSRVLQLFDAIGCQTDLDRARLLSLGAEPDKATVTGNLKFDRIPPETGPSVRAATLKKSGLPEGDWIVGGSTHQGEDELLLDIFVRIKDRYPSLRLLLAPRKRERFEAVWQLIQEQGLVAARRSNSQKPDGDIRIFLLDTQGELDSFYELADLVFMGKSMPGADEGGGHNLLEPAVRAKPIIFGPLMQNFPALAKMLIDGGGGRQIQDGDELAAAIAEMLDDPDSREQMGRMAREMSESHRGALDRTIHMISQVLQFQRTDRA